MSEEVDLVEIVVSVLESHAMIFAADTPSERVDGGSGELMSASIGYGGDGAGRLEIATSSNLAREVTMNVLGLDPDDELVDDYTTDSLCELANVLLGRVLHDSHAPTCVFNLQPPTAVANFSPEQWQSMAGDPGVLAFAADEGPLLVRFQIDSVVSAPGELA